MKITAIESFLLKIPYDNGGEPWNLTGKPWATLDILMLRIDTDEGVSGWGEAFGHAIIEGTKATLDQMVAPVLIGRDPREIGALFHEMRQKFHLFGYNGPALYALSGIDIALWDIAGKLAGLPIHRLIGGAARRELKAYASLMRYSDPAVVAKASARAVAEGYHAVKLHEITVEAVRAAREAIGRETPLMVDVNCPWSVLEAEEMARLCRPFDLYWLEEPVWPPDDHEGLARVRAVANASGMRIAAGENAASPTEFRHIFAAGAVDIAQPSVTKIGGITGALQVYALAAAHGVAIVPHCAYFGQGHLASLHLAASLPQAVPFERLFLDLEASPLSPWTEAKDGVLRVPDGPGLGCDPDMKLVERYRSHPPTTVR